MSTLPVEPARGGSLAPLIIGVLLVALLPLGIWWILSQQRPPTPGRYQLRVTTTPPTRFTGTYVRRDRSGATENKSVEGIGAGFYDAGDTVPKAVFQKAEAGGTLRVELLKDGKRQAVSTTRAPRGKVTLNGG